MIEKSKMELQAETDALKTGFDVLRDLGDSFEIARTHLKGALDRVMYQIGQREQIRTSGGVSFKNGELKFLNYGFEIIVVLDSKDARKLAYSILEHTEK